MNKVALVVGGTKGIGLGIANAFRKSGYTVKVIARQTSGTETPDYKVNVTCRNKYHNQLCQIRKDCPVIDTIACVAGGDARSARKLFDFNLGYVTKTIRMLADNLSRSEHPVFITLGTRYAFHQSSDPRYDGYSFLKLALMSNILLMSQRLPVCRFAYYAVPPTDTQTYWKAHKRPLNPRQTVFGFVEELATPSTIGNAIVENSAVLKPGFNCWGIDLDGRMLPLKSWIDLYPPLTF